MPTVAEIPSRDTLPPTDSAGLTAVEAAQRLRTVGPNQPSRTTHAGPVVQFLHLFANPLTVVLFGAGVVSGILGQFVDAAIIVIIVLLSVTLNFVQSYRSQQAAERLRQAVAPVATVQRDGIWCDLSPKELVPGDVVSLRAGDLVPADARLIEAKDLHVQQAALTGESLPVEKSATAVDRPLSGPEAPNLVFLGTSVVSGTAIAEVVATGARTAFGDIAARLERKPPETEFERGLRRFSYLIMRTVFFLVLFVLLANLAVHHDPWESLLFAVALAVGLTPEFLPMVTTVALVEGARHMARHAVIVKHLAAIQNFGSIDVLCSDKTGTLTSGAMILDQSVDALGQPSERVWMLAYLNSQYETGIRNPLDAAILEHGKPDLAVYRKVDEIPFDFERRRLSVVVDDDRERLLIAKGSPEGILECCKAYESSGQCLPLDAAAQDRLGAIYRDFSAEGYRVLAVAYRTVRIQPAYRVADETDLTLAGFLAFTDPPLADAGEIVSELQAAGVTIKVLTGDNQLVARHVCQSVGIDASRIVLGEELDQLDDQALEHVAEITPIFARVTPAQKDRIILALKRRGHVVGYLGDGINDAPSLRTADVGISVVNGADIAKDAAQIILLERNLEALRDGIEEGRKAFGNVMKYVFMGTSSNFGNMVSMAAAPLVLPYLPMLPTQILLNNFLYDLAQITIPTDRVDPDFTRRPRRWDIRLIRNFMLFIGPISSIYDYLTFFMLIAVFHAPERLFHTGWFVESLVTQTLVLFVIRTLGNPLRSRPSRPLAVTTLTIVAVAIGLPYSPLAGPLGFTPLPVTYFLFLTGAAGTYLLLVELTKRVVLRRYWA
jgi:Mg2+-importing ATPase